MTEDRDTQGKDSRYGGFAAATAEGTESSEEADTEDNPNEQDEDEAIEQPGEQQDPQPQEQSTEDHSESSTESPTAVTSEGVSAGDVNSASEAVKGTDTVQSVAGVPISEIPHRVKYNSVKEGRSPRTIWISEAEISDISGLRRQANEWYDEEVQTTDIYLALLRAGLEASDDALHEQLDEIGYGLLD